MNEEAEYNAGIRLLFEGGDCKRREMLVPYGSFHTSLPISGPIPPPTHLPLVR